jgi:glycosyltransferase involved in cell wall biosynthesis
MTVAMGANHRWDIAYIGLLTGHGGDALQMLSLANAMRVSGARVKIWVPRGDQSLEFQERCAALGIECERTDQIVADMHGPRQNLRSVLSLLRGIDASLVHFHTGNACLPRTVMIALEILRHPPVLVTLHSPYETVTPGSGRARFWATMARRRCLAVVSPSDHGTRYQRRCGLPVDLAVTIHNSIDVEAVADGSAGRARAMLGVDDDVPIVLFSSRIDVQKRPIDAVRIFAAAADVCPAATLVFVGRGEEEAAVVRAAADLGVGSRVRLAGYQTNVPDWLAAATVWLLPTERENFSIALLEALAAGCAILSTACPGNDEVLTDNHNALTFPIGDIEHAGAGLRRLLRDVPLRRRLGETARREAKAFSLEVMVDRYREIYACSPNAPASLRP